MITFFWRCEGTSLTTNADFSLSDTSAGGATLATIDASAARVGSNGILCDSSGEQFRFNTNSIWLTSAGSAGFSIRFPSDPADGTTLMVARDGDGSDRYSIDCDSTKILEFNAYAGGVQQYNIISNISLSNNTWYGVIVRWDQPNNTVALEIYDSSNICIDKILSTTAYTLPSQTDLDASTNGFRIGPDTASTTHYDNIFLSDDFDEPIQNNFTITSILGYQNEISFDAATEHVRTATTSPQTFSHGGASSGVGAVILKLVHGTSSTDHVSAASYGGVAMSRIQRNTDTATEPGAAEIWFLGSSSIPQGTQTVSYTPGATTDDFHAICETYLCNGPTEIIDNDGVTDNVTDPSVTLSGSNNRWAMATAMLYGGGAAPSSFAPNASCLTVHDHDLGAFYSEGIRFATATRASSIVIGGTAATDDVAYAAVAFAKIPIPRSFTVTV